ncbi:MAG: hypothetical protein V1694_01245 [Candidatus Eisenbacteria bacterium]
MLLVVLFADKAALCGPSGEDAPAHTNLDPAQVERICLEALEQPDRHAALRSLRDALPAIKSELAGIRNEGFLATHELLMGARRRADWEDAGRRAARALNHRGHDLLRSLGFRIEPCDRVTSILRTQDRKIAVAVLLNRDESPELQAQRFSDHSPVGYALAVADRENLPYVVVQHEAKIRLYPTHVGVGVGRRGRSETYAECHTGLLNSKDLPLLWLLFSAEALLEGGSLQQLIEASGRFSGDLAERLRDRVYQSVIPKLAEGIAAARGLKRPSAEHLRVTYEMAMTVLFRLLFIAYAEDKDLLPYRWNGLYQRRSLKTKAQEILELFQSGTDFAEGDSLWMEVGRLFQAVESGNREWSVPAYNGGLFSQDTEVSRIGGLVSEICLPNGVFGPALRDLLLVDSPEGLGPVDFRSLGVGEFGTIYEGLLESELSVAETDLTTETKTEKGTKREFYRPCKKGEEPLIAKGLIYLHNASGARKSTGSYFTKPFAVEHLLERALEPALDDHLTRLDKVSDDEAGEQFFDFRVADIAMGSGHFLVAAIDHIERRLSDYLTRRSLPGVRTEIAALRAAAIETLGPIADQVEIDDTQLLRRLIARRCIYGVDLNPTATQLARLAIWIHTFVPGLPLSLLDHNLVCGNSLVGIGTLAEISTKIEEQSSPMFPVDAEYLLGEARTHLQRLGRIADANPADLKRARQAWDAALKVIAPTAALCDIVAARRLKSESLPFDATDWGEVKRDIVNSKHHRQAQKTLEGLAALHFPIAFPEVFLRARPGFDVIIGNPPWQEATLEEDAFWARHVPGLRGLSQREQEAAKTKLRKDRSDLYAQYERELAAAESLRHALTAGAFPGMGTGDPDLYKAFCWRFWHLSAQDGGRIGVVLPRSALAAKGSTEFRVELFEHADNMDVTTLLNNRQWFFEDVHPQYTIGLVAFEKQKSKRTPVALRGPYPSYQRYTDGIVKEPAVFYGKEIKEWNDTASLPLLPTEESVEVFAQLRKSPRLDFDDGKSWRARPHTELHATNEKKCMDLKSDKCPRGFWPVCKGESFDIWNPDSGTYYAWADPDVVIPYLQAKRMHGGKLKSSPFSEFDPAWVRDPKTLPCLHARIAFRDVTNRTNRRTVIAALLPPKVFVTNKGPYLLWPRGSAKDQAFLVGILSSIPTDWYARRFVEISLNFFVFNPIPVPRPDEGDTLQRRAIALSGRLACPDERFAAWAKGVGVKAGPLEPDEKEDKIHELDAVVAHLYGLTEKHLIHIFETFHEGWNYEERLRATLQHFRKWRDRP